mmetsp:Transcript_4399/g.13922  ORF Transcript_4399/g.13922 Transcript_4399/m.13922 type:complete len:143 (-) Transcript_4399:301-729(-)
MRGYVNRETDPFLQEHARRFPPMGGLGEPASVINYEHRWIEMRRGHRRPTAVRDPQPWSSDSFASLSWSRRAAALAGVRPAAVRRSRRLGDDLPAFFLEAIKATEATGTARHQAGRRENPTRCWLEQEVREGESLYISIVKM